MRSPFSEGEKLAFELPDEERALLEAHLLKSLPPVLEDEDEGLAEALLRYGEIEANRVSAISLEELDQQIARQRSS